MSTWTSRRVLVTGATGLVGSWLVPKLLDLGAEVVALVLDADPQSELVRSGTLQRCTVVSGRLEDMADLTRAVVWQEVDTVFHLGAQTLVGTALADPLSTFEANVRGTYQLLEVCRRRKDAVKRIVVASSDKAYGDSEVLPYTEEMPANGRHPYDVSKSCADLLARSYASTYGLPIGIARCGNVYGGGDLNWSRIVPGTIRSVLQGKRPVLRSDGSPTRDYLFVDDVVDGYLALGDAVERSDVRGEAFNFSPETQVSVMAVTEALLRILGREDLPPVILAEARAEIQDQYLSSAKAKRLLKWKPVHGLEPGLEKTVAWYRDYLGARA